MSVIHEALEKLDQEKNPKGPAAVLTPEERTAKGSSESAVSALQKEKKNPPESSRALFAIGGVLLLFFIAGLIYLFGRSFSKETPTEISTSTQEEAPSPPAFFSQVPSTNQFVLTGITGSDGDLIAVINNQLVQVGHRVKGALVKEIQRDKVVLEFSSGRQITLTL
jgi:hypothetical protein